MAQLSKRGPKQKHQAKAPDNATPLAVQVTMSGDQNAQAAPDQIDQGAPVPKKPKKISDQVARWKATKAFPTNWIITEVQSPNPKRRTAAKRFDFYKDGMTVEEYVKASHEAGNTKALAVADVRWDHCAGFIKVVEKE